MKELQELRNKIDEIDSKLIEIFEERMKVVSEVGRVKRENGIGTLNEKREEAVIERGRSLVKDKTYEESTISMLKSIMAISRSHQNSSNCRDKIDAIEKSNIEFMNSVGLLVQENEKTYNENFSKIL